MRAHAKLGLLHHEVPNGDGNMVENFVINHWHWETRPLAETFKCLLTYIDKYPLLQFLELVKETAKATSIHNDNQCR